MIAVIGATGNTGRALVKELTALGHAPVSVVRNADKAREVLGPNAKVAIAELADKAALEKALQGVTSVFVVTGHNRGKGDCFHTGQGSDVEGVLPGDTSIV